MDRRGRSQAYSVYGDELDAVFAAAVRQMLGRPGEAWGAESGVDRLVVVRYE